jgi:hypothetical protein
MILSTTNAGKTSQHSERNVKAKLPVTSPSARVKPAESANCSVLQSTRPPAIVATDADLALPGRRPFSRPALSPATENNDATPEPLPVGGIEPTVFPAVRPFKHTAQVAANPVCPPSATRRCRRLFFWVAVLCAGEIADRAIVDRADLWKTVSITSS